MSVDIIVYNLIRITCEESLLREVQDFLDSDDGIKPMPSDLNHGSNEVVSSIDQDGILEYDFNSLDIPVSTYSKLLERFPDCKVSWKYEYYNPYRHEVEGYLEEEV